MEYDFSKDKLPYLFRNQSGLVIDGGLKGRVDMRKRV
jgi:hypothetical protein